jgi:thymidine kinase
MCCAQNQIIKKALFTRKIVPGKDIVVIGGKETYIPVCRECYHSKNVIE